MGSTTFHHLKKILKQKGLNTSVGDEGGFAPMLEDNDTALQCILEAIQAAGYQPHEDICIALDLSLIHIYNTFHQITHLTKFMRLIIHP